MKKPLWNLYIFFTFFIPECMPTCGFKLHNQTLRHFILTKKLNQVSSNYKKTEDNAIRTVIVVRKLSTCFMYCFYFILLVESKIWLRCCTINMFCYDLQWLFFIYPIRIIFLSGSVILHFIFFYFCLCSFLLLHWPLINYFLIWKIIYVYLYFVSNIAWWEF